MGIGHDEAFYFVLSAISIMDEHLTPLMRQRI